MTDSRIVPLLSCFLYNSLAAEDNGRVSLYNYWHAAMPDNYPSAPGTGSPATSSDATLHPLARLPKHRYGGTGRAMFFVSSAASYHRMPGFPT